MKTKSVNECMQDMGMQEMRSVNGGNPLVVKALEFVLGVVAGELLDRSSGDDFMDGWNDAKKNK